MCRHRPTSAKKSSHAIEKEEKKKCIETFHNLSPEQYCAKSINILSPLIFMFLREREQRRVCCVVKRESKASRSELCEMVYVVLRQQQLSLPPTHAKPFFCTNTSVDGSQNKSIKLRYHHLFLSLSHTFYVSLLLSLALFAPCSCHAP